MSILCLVAADPQPFEHTWVWWWDFVARSQSSRDSDFRKALKEIAVINGVQRFWAVFNRVCLPSKVGFIMVQH